MERSQQFEIDQGVWHLELKKCPECGANNPKTRRCYKCGYIFQVEEENEMNQVEGEIVEAMTFLDDE